jgi:ABC-2 type transport system permease protein
MSTITSPRTSLAQDVVTVLVRELRPILLAPWALAFTLVQPLLLLAFFAPLLAVAGSARPGGGTLQWFVPGVLVMLGLFETAGAGANLMFEAQTGAHERMLVSPLRRSSLLIGRALKDLVPIVGQAVLVVAVVLPFGFRLHLPGALLGLAILGVLGIGIGALSYALALLVRRQDWIFWVTTQTLTFPLLVLSGLLLPLDGAPGWMAAVSRVNPLTHVATAERALFAGGFPVADVLAGIAAAVGTAAVGLAVGVRVVRRSQG